MGIREKKLTQFDETLIKSTKIGRYCVYESPTNLLIFFRKKS